MFEDIIEFEEIGCVETHDLEIDSKHHNFYANDICVSNSHSVSYTYISMQTLYLKHYYPTYFYTALLNQPKSSNEGKEEEKKWLTQTIAAAVSKGITVKPPSRKSKWRWSMTGPSEITMGFSSINNMGHKAYEELMSALKVKKKTFENISMAAFFDLPLSTYNKASFGGCVKAGIFDDWSSSREFLLSVHEKQKKKRKNKALPGQVALFDIDELEYTHKIDSSKFAMTSDFEKKEQFIEVCGIDMDEIKRISSIHSKMSALNDRAKYPVLPLTHYDDEGFYWFILQDIIYKKTKKEKDYICLVVGDGVETLRFNVFAPLSDKMKDELQRQGVYVGKFKKKDGWLNYDGRNKLKAVMHPFEDKLLV